MGSPLSLLFSKLNKPTTLSSPRKSCPLVISPSLLLSFGHILIFLYPSYIMDPETAHYLRWGHTNDGTNTFKYLAILRLTDPGVQLALLATRACYWLVLTKTPRCLSTGGTPGSCSPIYMYNQDFTVPGAESGIFLVKFHMVDNWAVL